VDGLQCFSDVNGIVSLLVHEQESLLAQVHSGDSPAGLLHLLEQLEALTHSTVMPTTPSSSIETLQLQLRLLEARIPHNPL
jgi:hypothetical protein